MQQPQDKLEIGKSSQKEEELEIWIDNIDPKYKETALDAARRMPVEGTLKVRSEFVWKYMTMKHPEIAWGVIVDTVINLDTTFMWYSDHKSQLLCFKLNNI